MDNAILRVKNLGVSFDGNHVLKDLDFSVNKGDVLAIVGPNGAGKSVLFRALLDLIPHSGQIEWAKDLKISYVPQKFSIDRELPLSTEEFLKFKGQIQNDIFMSKGKAVTNNWFDREYSNYYIKNLL